MLGDRIRMATLLSINRRTQEQVEALAPPMLTSKLFLPDAPCHFDLKERRPIPGEKHQYTIWAVTNLVNTLGELGQLDEAVLSLEVTEESMRLQGKSYNRRRFNLKPRPTYPSMIWLRLYLRGPIPERYPVCQYTALEVLI